MMKRMTKEAMVDLEDTGAMEVGSFSNMLL